MVSLIFPVHLSISIAEANQHPVAFFVGHSEWNKGAQGINGMPTEWDYCRLLADEVIKFAPEYGVTLKVFYRDNFESYPQAIDDIWKRKNAWSMRAPAVSCHYNMTPGNVKDIQQNATLRQLFINKEVPPKKGSLQGTWVLYQPNDETRKIAQHLLKNILAIMPRNNLDDRDVSEIIPVVKGDRGGRMMLSPYAKAPAMLLEIGYADNPSEVALMQEEKFKEKLAKAILKTFSEAITKN